MTPTQFAIMAGAFLAVLMTIMVAMFLFSVSFGGRKRRKEPFPELLDSLKGHYEGFGGYQMVGTSTQELEQAIPQAIEAGKLIHAKHLALVRRHVSGGQAGIPLELREVLLPDILRMRERVTPELMAQHIAHPLIQSPLTPILASLSRPLLRYSAQSPDSFGLKAEKRAGNHHFMDPILGYLSRVSRILLNYEPELYYQKEVHLKHANTTKMGQWFPSLILGSTFLELPENEQLFSLAAKVAPFRPELRILLVYPEEEQFTAFVEELIRVQEGGRSALVEKILRTLSGPEQEALLKSLRALPIFDPFELLEWRRGALLTAHRLAFILVDRWSDIQSALLRQGNEGAVEDLLVYMTSENFITVLSALGAIPRPDDI